MKKLNFIIIFTLCTCLIGLHANAQEEAETNKSGTTVAQFLKIGVGARAMGQAGSFVAHSDDVYSLYWNPAGITKVKNVAFAVVHTEWFADITHQFLGLVLPVNANSAVGFQATILNMDQIEITTIDEPHGTGEFYDAGDLAIGVSYAIKLTNFFAVGITGKYIQQKIYNESASTYAFDISSQLDVPFHGLKMGMNFSNFGGKMKMDGRDLIREYDLNPENTLNDGVETHLKTEPWELPVNFAVGLAVDLIGRNDAFLKMNDNEMTFSITGNHPADAKEFASFGVEYTFQNVVSLRSGYRLNRDIEKFYYGFGLKVPIPGAAFNFDYSVASFDELDNIHIFSASVSLD